MKPFANIPGVTYPEPPAPKDGRGRSPRILQVPGYNFCRRWLKAHHVVGVIILPDGGRPNYCASDFDYQ